MSEEDRLTKSKVESMKAKKELLREMIKFKVSEAKATGQDFIQQINDAEKIEKGSSIKLFEGTDKQWKSQLIKALILNGANFGEKSLRNMLSATLGKWATTTKSAKDKKAGRDEYAGVLKAVLGDIAMEEAIQANQATMPQEPQEEAGTLVVQRGAAARRPSPRRLSTPRDAPTPDPPMPMTLGPNYNYHNDESVLPTLNDQDLMLTDEDHDELLARIDATAKAKVAANNEAFQTYCRSLQDVSRDYNETLESTIAGNVRDANEAVQNTLRDANESAQTTIAGNLRDAHETVKNTLRDANETVEKTLTGMIQHQGSVLATELKTVMDKNNTVLEKSKADAQKLVLSRSAHRHRRIRTAGASPRFGELAPFHERRKSSDDMTRLVNHVSRDGSPTLGEESLVYTKMPDAKVDLLARSSPEKFHDLDDESSADAGNGTDSPAKENTKKHDSNDGNGNASILSWLQGTQS
jgi:hypothetical protein